ncbi:MAG TPA: serine protease [Bacteroidales bacterium]
MSCSRQPINLNTAIVADNKYDSEFPQQSVSKELTYVSNTVKKIDCLVFYMNYVFPPGNNIDRVQLNDSIVRFASIANEVTNESVTGTSTVIYQDTKQIGLITCAHVIDFPDSLFSYYPEDIGGLRVLAVKIKHQIFVAGLSQGEEVSIVIEDTKKDIAILKKVLETQNEGINVLNLPVGNTKDLDWGSVVYIVGYPLGNLMVTNAIVSNPKKADNGTFLTNALYNRGISGSPVLSIRDGNSNFELVGMASSASAQTIQFLRPEKDVPPQTNADGTYSGKLFPDQKKDINYGVTYSVSIEEITGLIKNNKSLLEKEGFQYDLFFK